MIMIERIIGKKKKKVCVEKLRGCLIFLVFC